MWCCTKFGSWQRAHFWIAPHAGSRFVSVCLPITYVWFPNAFTWCLQVKSVTDKDVVCVVLEGGTFKSRRHLNVRGTTADLPSITDKDWSDLKFGVENGVDFYALSFVHDAKTIETVKKFLSDHVRPSCVCTCHLVSRIFRKAWNLWMRWLRSQPNSQMLGEDKHNVSISFCSCCC